MAKRFVIGSDPVSDALAKKLFPGRSVQDLVLNFPFEGVATIEVSFFMDPSDAANIESMAERLRDATSEQGDE